MAGKLWKGGERMYLDATKVYRECIENAFLSLKFSNKI